MKRFTLLALLLLLPVALLAQTPHYQSHFPPEEFKARWAKLFDQIGTCDDRRQRVPVAHWFAHRHDVGHYTGQLVPPHAPGAAESGLNFVGDEQTSGGAYVRHGPLHEAPWHVR